MEPSIDAASKVAARINKNVICPVCSSGLMVLMPFDLCPTQDVLTCASCGAELYVTVLKGK